MTDSKCEAWPHVGARCTELADRVAELEAENQRLTARSTGEDEMKLLKDDYKASERRCVELEQENERLRAGLMAEKAAASAMGEAVAMAMGEQEAEIRKLRAGLDKVQKLRDVIIDLHWKYSTMIGLATAIRDTLTEALAGVDHG